MTERSLQVTYRKGRPFAAYLHLSHPTGEKTAKTKPSPDGLLVVDYSVTDHPVGIEITAPLAVPLERLNQLLADLGQAPLAEQDYKPVLAASSRGLRPAGLASPDPRWAIGRRLLLSLLRNQEVGGSIPPWSTNLENRECPGVSQG